MIYSNLKRIILMGCLTLTASTATANEAEDQAINALASLLFHVENEINDNRTIHFEEADIEHLWSHALLINNSLVEAKDHYDLSRQLDDPSCLSKCKNLLHSTWIAVNTSENSDPLPSYSTDPSLAKSIKKEISPHLPPSSFPYLSIINWIFNTSRPTYDKSSLVNAGFNILHKQPRSFIIVAEHPSVPNYLFKLYLDTELRIKRDVPGWKWFVRRCEGANRIKEVIQEKNIQHFVVPQKYIYPLPASTRPHSSATIDPKPVVLIAQNMHLVPKHDNHEAWKTKITPEILKELYLIISRAHGSSYRADNIPFTQSGKFAFIDTEYPYNKSPDFSGIRPYLSYEMCAYWDSLVRKGG